MFKDIIKSFLPWILFFVLAGKTQQQLDIAIITAAITSVVFELKYLKKGFVLSWGTFLFFIFMLVEVTLFKNAWAVKYYSLLSNSALATIVWVSILIRKPFTIQYAKEQVSADKWQHPVFLKINYGLTAVWGFAFLICIALDVLQIYYPEFSGWNFEMLTYVPSVLAIGFTKWFPDWYKAKYLSNLAKPSKEANPYLSGSFAPVQDELDTHDLKVTGEIPKDLLGIYMRNGPNPAFPPISYTFPYDGDGMIHAIYIKDGKAAYRNRYVATKGLIKERKAGKALYGGLLKLLPMDPKWADPEDEPVAIKNGAFIHIIRHADKYLALNEGVPAYQLTSQLKTIGEWNPTLSAKPLDVCAHTRLDPATGDLWFINYGLTPPFLTIFHFDKPGHLVKKWDIEKSHATMLHDFVLTQNYVIIFDCPAVFDINQIQRGGSVLSWQPELGTRIGIMSRQSGKMQWFATDPFFVFHFANAYEHDNDIIIDYVRHENLDLQPKGIDLNKKPPALYRTIINANNGVMKHIKLDDKLIEFPRIREDRDTLSHQYIYTPTKTPDVHDKRVFNALVKYDVNKQQSEVHDFGKFAAIGEAVFAPASMSRSEDQGYVMLFVNDTTTDQSEFVILDAENFTSPPLARIAMPRRIPNGLHGSWMAGEWQ